MSYVKQLVITNSEGEQTTCRLDGADTWKIGRADSNSIILNADTVSRVHAIIRRAEDEKYYLKDAESHNGTFLNGERINAETLLNEDDEISIGGCTLVFTLTPLTKELPRETEEAIVETLLTQTCLNRQQSPEELLASVYQELRQVARAYMRHERPDHTLQATALVNEAYLRLFEGQPVHWENRKHLFCTIARSMRRVLVDHARAKAAERHGGAIQRISLEDHSPAVFHDLSDVLALDEALGRLAKRSPRQAQVVELHFFAGLTEDEVAHVLNVSLKTIKNDWHAAKDELRKAMM